MKSHRFGLLAAAVLTLGALIGSMASASAADPINRYLKAQPAPEFHWNGVYLKGELGYAFGDVDFSAAGQSVTVKPQGVNAALGLGYNFHLSRNWVLGIETDIGWLGAARSTNIGGASLSADLDYYGTITGKVGYSFGTWMLYAKGGYAWGHIRSDVSLVNLSADDFVNGWAYGAGAEFALSKNWSLTAEWVRLDFRTAALDFGPGSVAAEAVIDLAKAGVRYRF